MLEINKLENHEPLIYFKNKRLKINKIDKSSSSIFLYYSNLNLKDSKVDVILKNIKTREEFKCDFNITDKYIEIYLDALIDFFTDNEASIFIAIKNDNIIYHYIPLVDSCEFKGTYSNGNYKWFIRTSPNGELRLSCYRLITA